MMTGDQCGVGHDGSRGAAYVQGWIKALEKTTRKRFTRPRPRRSA